MQIVRRIEYALEIFSLKETLRIATKTMDINGYIYDNIIKSVGAESSRIDPEDFNSSINSVDFEVFAQDGRTFINSFKGSYCYVYEIEPQTYKTDGLDAYVVSDDRVINKYLANIEGVSTNADLSLVDFSVVFDKSKVFDQSVLQKFDKNTFAKYLTLSLQPKTLQTFVPIPDLTSDSCTPLGPVKSFMASNTFAGGDLTRKNTVTKQAVVAGQIDPAILTDNNQLTFSPLMVEQMSGKVRDNIPIRNQGDLIQIIIPKSFVDRLAEKYGGTGGQSSRKKFFDVFGGGGEYPVAKLTDVFEAQPFTESGNTITLSFNEYELDEPKQLYLYSWVNDEGKVVLNNNEEEEGEAGDRDGDSWSVETASDFRKLQDDVTTVTTFLNNFESEGKLFPFSLEFNSFWLMTKGIVTNRMIGLNSVPFSENPYNFYPQPGQGGVPPLEDTIRTSPTGYLVPAYAQQTEEEDFYVFNCTRVHDLRDIHAYRVPSTGNGTEIEFNNTTYKGGTDPNSGDMKSDFGLFLQAYNEPGKQSDRQKLFHEGFLKAYEKYESGEVDPGEDQKAAGLSPFKWFVGVADSVEVIKEAFVPAEEIKDLPYEDFVDLRLDVISSTDKSRAINFTSITENSITNASVNSGFEEQTINYEDIYESVDGRFGYIESIAPYQIDGKSQYIINFYTTRQWDSDTGNQSFPNALVISDEYNGAPQSGMITFRTPPENGAEGGQIIPIIYGYVSKYPVIQAISKKQNFGDPVGAGDDIYILCSNQLARKDGNSVLVYWGLDEIAGGSGSLSAPGSERSLFQSGLDKAKKFYISNPLPRVGKIPVQYVDIEKVEIAGLPDSRLAPTRITQYKNEPHPFHYTIEIEDNNGFVHSGIRLRGDEWIATLGEQDPRHVIKNGLGSSRLYCSFIGMPDDNFGSITGMPNAPITHPAHILHHMLRNYCNIFDPDSQIDKESFKYAFSKDPNLFMGYAIDQDSITFDIISKTIAESSYIFLTYNKGMYKAKVFDLDVSQLPDWTIEQDDVLDLSTELFFPGVTDYRFNFNKNHATDKYDQTYYYNPNNCKKAQVASMFASERESLSIDLEAIYDEATAKKIMPKYIDLMSGYRTKIEIDIPNNYKNFREIEHCDIIELTVDRGYDFANSEKGFFREKFIVIETTRRQTGIEVTAIQLKSRDLKDRKKKYRYFKPLILSGGGGGGIILPGISE